jgi:hypothetical protein
MLQPPPGASGAPEPHAPVVAKVVMTRFTGELQSGQRNAD